MLYSSSFYFKRLSLLLACKACLMLAFILFAGIGLSPDEAQYWTWSQQLDWGYYSKPPGIAWQIWLGTRLFGDTELGVRSLSVILSIAQALAVFFTALQAGLQARTAFWSGVLMAFCPIGMLGSLLAITDGGFLLCWTLAVLFMVSALRESKEANPLLIGGCILGGALFKWPIYLFWIFFLLARHWWFPHQPLRKSLQGMAFSLAGLLPSFWWNWSHDWATFRHVSSTVQGGHGSQSGNVLEFIGSQALLLSPLLFILLCLGMRAWLKQRRHLSSPLFFCGFITLACLSAGILAAFFQKIQGNWVVFAYPTGLIFLGWFVFEAHVIKEGWLKAGLALSLCLTISVFLLPFLYASSIRRPAILSYRLNPFKHNVGWAHLKEALSHYGYDPQEHFLLSDKYQTTSILSFYNEGQKRAYFLNLHGVRKNQFSYWPSLPEEQQGKSGYFVWIENHPHLEREGKSKLVFYLDRLKPYFETVEFLEFVPLFYDRQQVVKGALLFKCENCQSHQPDDPDLY
ncbi:ArnT family glycosyltransferase [Candidatus Protochlamydia phocaeensis]|uniref:ArnT family glycosyltransferase n=1 Tax=Candidatus Protochlamydia phocaeensis TaxID=1414722 RepID=UPI000838F1E0|nr:glycosyltransferase family 39 protein [Candidatus Protochlamydia phocaeensis]